MTNTITIEGYVTSKGAETRQAGEYLILKFSLSNPIKEGKKDWMNFFDCEIFGKFAEVMVPYIQAKTRLTVTGKLKQERWENEQGQTRSSFKIKVSELSFGAKGEETEKSSAPWEDTVSQKIDNSEIPF